MPRIVSVFVLGFALAAGACHDPPPAPPDLRLVQVSNVAPLSMPGPYVTVDWTASPPRVTVRETRSGSWGALLPGTLTSTGLSELEAATRALSDGWDPPYDACYDDIAFPCSSYQFDSDGQPVAADAVGGTPEGMALDAWVQHVLADATSCAPTYLVLDQPPRCP